MKKLLFLVFVLAGLQGTVLAQQKIETATVKTQIKCDHCKQCGSCSARLEKALYDKKGIKRVDVDDRKMTIKVVYNTQKINMDDIRNTIAANGFDADDVKALPEAVERLDDCCKGAE